VSDRDGRQTGAMTAPTDRTPDAGEWDERYRTAQQIWSGEPNGALVAEATALEPGRALDVGCGEGADAVWLARRGWQVTALDVSQVALARAQHHARDAGVEVAWVHAGLVEAGLPAGGFDLVSAQYPVLRKTEGAVAERTLVGLVAPGGTLLMVHHDLDADHDHDHEGGFDPEDYALPADVAAVLGEGWTIEVDERRPRVVSGGAGAHHVQDLVLRARRG
jgi:SAM-dependent methyltransferase